MTDAPGSSPALPDVEAAAHFHQSGAPFGANRATEGIFSLGQNYPNPHQGETTIPFTLSTKADVHLDLFDSIGRKMAGVVRKNRNAGPQSIALNLAGLGLPAGNYIYQLQVHSALGAHQQSRQMTIEID